MKILLSPRILPFLIFMVFIGVDNGLHHLAMDGILNGFDEKLFLFLYPGRTVLVGLLLLYFFRKGAYPEVDFRDWKRWGPSLSSIVVGLLVFVVWIQLEAASFGSPQGYDPTLVQDKFLRAILITFRLAGAALIVPVMEEIFWRSFLMRYIIDPDIDQVPVGRFSWPSFIFTALLFGLEHHLILAGVLAGVAYALLLYQTRSLAQCILCHGVTNLALGIFVLKSGQWQFW